MTRVVLRVGARCDPGSVLWSPEASADERIATFEDVATARAGGDELTLLGVDGLGFGGRRSMSSGEGSVEPGVLDWVGVAHAAGFRRVGLRTSARPLAVDGTAAQLHAAGCTDLLVPMYGSTSACHDYHAGGAGRFAATLAGIASARAAGLEVAAVTAVTRSNYRALSSLGALLAARDVNGWLLVLPAHIDDADERFDRVVPRLALALPYLLHALDRALAGGLPTWARGVPLCRVGRFARRVLPARALEHGAACSECAVRSRCAGVAGGYLRRYGDGELAPFERRQPREGTEPAPVDAQRFVVDYEPSTLSLRLAAEPPLR